MCVIEQWQQVYQDGSVRTVEATKECSRCLKYGYCHRGQTVRMDPEYINRPTAPKPGSSDDSKKPKDNKDTKGKSKEKIPPKQGIGLEWSWGPNNKKVPAFVRPKPNPRSKSVPPISRVPFADLLDRPSQPRPEDRPQSFPLRPQPQIHQQPGMQPPQPGPGGFPPGMQGPPPPPPHPMYPRPGMYPGSGMPPYTQPVRPPQPQFVPQPGPRVYSRQPPRPPPREADIVNIRPPRENVRQVLIEPPPEVIIPSREHRRRSPSPGPRSPRRPRPGSGGPSNGAAVNALLEADHRARRAEAELQQVQGQLQAARRDIAREQDLRRLTEREGQLREQLAELKGRQQIRDEFKAVDEQRRIQAARPPVIHQIRNSSRGPRRVMPSLDLSREPRQHDNTPPRSPYDPREGRRPRRNSHGGKYHDSDGDEMRPRSSSRGGVDNSFVGRSFRDRRDGPPTSGRGWDTVRRRAEEESDRELRRRRGERPVHEDRWSRPI